MKVQQEILPFRPITIKLEKKHEAESFFNIIDKVESFRCNADHGITPKSFTNYEIELLITLSDARSTQEIII